jgi:hypothetical protein
LRVIKFHDEPVGGGDTGGMSSQTADVALTAADASRRPMIIQRMGIEEFSFWFGRARALGSVE